MVDNLEQKIDAEIRAGLNNEKTRIADAQKRLDFLAGEFSRWTHRAPDFSRDGNRFQRVSLLMKRAIDTLTADLYRRGPARRLAPEHERAQEWLLDVYSKNGIDSLFQQADRLALAADAVAIEVVPQPDPDCPVKLRLWDSASFVVWCDPDDALKVVAVGAIDLYDEQRRMTVWTQSEVRKYTTRKLLPGQTSGGTAYSLESADQNPYGVIPFSFVHGEQPVSHFWATSVGAALCQVNDALNLALTDVGDSVRYSAKPILVATGVGVGWRPPSIRPGDLWTPPSGERTAGGAGDAPKIEYLQANIAFIEASWVDIDHLVDHSLQGAGVPPAAYRLNSTSTKSGAALVAEQLPLARWAEGRTRPFSCYEADLAKVVLAVGAAHLAMNGDPLAADLAAAAASPGFVAHFPSMMPESPLSADQIASDKADLELGLTSKVRLIMKRFSVSREEAIAYLEELAEDEQILAEIGVAVEPDEAKSDAANAEALETEEETAEDEADGSEENE